MARYEVVVMEYKTPAAKTFTTTSAHGSAFKRGHVFKQLMKREAKRARGHHDQDSSITPDNYAFEMLGQERVGSISCTVVHAIPKRRDTYLFEGEIWINDQDFAIVKAAGHLAKSPSHWIKRVAFVRQYQKIDGFWLPLREQPIARRSTAPTEIMLGRPERTLIEKPCDMESKYFHGTQKKDPHRSGLDCPEAASVGANRLPPLCSSSDFVVHTVSDFSEKLVGMAFFFFNGLNDA